MGFIPAPSTIQDMRVMNLFHKFNKKNVWNNAISLKMLNFKGKGIILYKYPYWKGLMIRYLTAILAFRPSITYHTHSVFDADQRGIGQFFLSGLDTWKSGLNLNPMRGTPPSAVPGIDFSAYFMEDK